MFTSNNTSIEEFKKAFDMKAIINFDDIRHIDFFKKHI
jgi:diaminopimelate decarboxylase